MKDYNIYLQKAHRFIVKEILSDVAKEGLGEGSGLFITFKTNRDDVIIPDFVRAKYPTEISIILQYQFENLIANEKSFSVDLAFGGILSTITVPYTALTQFVDKEANFGLMLVPVQEKETNETKSMNEASSDSAQIIDLDSFRKK